MSGVEGFLRLTLVNELLFKKLGDFAGVDRGVSIKSGHNGGGGGGTEELIKGDIGFFMSAVSGSTSV